MNPMQRNELAAHIVARYATWSSMINSGRFSDQFSNAATVRKDDFERIIAALKEVQRHDLVAVADLRSRGLVENTRITDTVVGVENTSEMEAAQNSMNVAQLGMNKSVYAQTYTPNPIVHHTHGIDWRQNFGYSVTNGNKESMRKVMERSEANVVNGDSTLVVRFNGANQVMYGYTSHPNRTTVAVDDWAVSTTNLLANVNSLMSAMYNTNKIKAARGTIIMYVPTNSYMVLRQQAFSNKGDMTFEQQILTSYPEIAKIEPLPDLATGNPLLVYMKPQHVSLAISQAPVTVPHLKNLEILPQLFTTYAVWTLIIHVDSNSLTGIVQGT